MKKLRFSRPFRRKGYRAFVAYARFGLNRNQKGQVLVYVPKNFCKNAVMYEILL